ncbi:cholesterol oxidase substrate-binding domain-containing protein [Xenorhabdus hominickii]|uniref:FAD-linked oxidase n=1 Tax=Xenorhabdus hominickii TaxID=351679 RepID=A0A2G0QGI7_XENHO|nr:cholesterol oxidase substrate-binding domain-containing protein [Xenorhabdus hominickii]AOM42318.1 FAD-linked oxidase [Xenorhabdus hominickii]PHM58326.1 FAD-linked oxidase [Xenorhabdus hominickii]
MYTINSDKKHNSPPNKNITFQKEKKLNGFPGKVKLEYRNFQNWSKEIKADKVLCCIPSSIDEVLSVVNWAWQQKYKLRPIGQSHNWSPLILKPYSSNNVLLMDLQKYFTQVIIEKSDQSFIVKAQTGILMETLMTTMEEHGLGFIATPAPGDLTLGGVLAIGGHGTAIKALEEKSEAGHIYGSLSNAILALSAVVWDETSQQYILKNFQRTEAECAPLLTHLGSALILDVKLQAGKNQRLRCESFFDITASELFSLPQNKKNNKRTISHFLDKSGRAEVILFPFTENPWLKIWSIAPQKPSSSIEVTTPYNYPFSDNIPSDISELTKLVLSTAPNLTPLLSKIQYLLASNAIGREKDIWGWSKNLLLYIKPTTLRVTANGYAILTRRADIQRVLHAFYTKWKALMQAFKKKEKYPINGPIEVRVTGLDTPSEAICKNAVVPSLSAIRPRPDKPEWDVAVWLDVLTLPKTPHSIEFLHQFEKWLFAEFNGDYASARVEWSKGWAYSEHAAWEDETILTKIIPSSFADGLPTDNNWSTAIATLHKYDPHHIFRSPLLEKLLSD